MQPIMILVLVLVLLALFVVLTYNKMIKIRNRVDEAWSDIDVQLKRRYNLIPNIVETVKGYATHEEGVLTKVTEARSNAINATNIQEQGQAENMLSGALKSLFAVAENYPDLKANENFLQLQNELVDTEDKIQAARRFHNGVVRDYNTKVQTFPNSIIAKMFKFADREFFEIEEEEQKENVKVDFSKDGGEKPAEAAAPAAPAETPAEPTPTPEAPAEPAAPEAPVETPAPEMPAEEPKTEEAPAPEAPTPLTPATPEAPATPEPAPLTPEAPAEEPKNEEMPAEPAAPEMPAETPTPLTPAEPEAPAAPEAPVETPAPEAPAEEEKKEGDTPAAPTA